jgi:hypothetical protein
MYIPDLPGEFLPRQASFFCHVSEAARLQRASIPARRKRAAMVFSALAEKTLNVAPLPCR